MKKNITKLLSLLLTLVLLLGMLPLSAMAEETGAELSGENPGTEGFPSSEDREEEEKTGEPEACLLYTSGKAGPDGDCMGALAFPVCGRAACAADAGAWAVLGGIRRLSAAWAEALPASGTAYGAGVLCALRRPADGD